MKELFLQKGIDEKVFDYLTDEDLELLSNNLDDCLSIINYLKCIGINNISELLVNKLDLFIRTKIEVESLFSKKNINYLVGLINDDSSNIDLLFE